MTHAHSSSTSFELQAFNFTLFNLKLTSLVGVVSAVVNLTDLILSKRIPIQFTWDYTCFLQYKILNNNYFYLVWIILILLRLHYLFLGIRNKLSICWLWFIYLLKYAILMQIACIYLQFIMDLDFNLLIDCFRNCFVIEKFRILNIFIDWSNIWLIIFLIDLIFWLIFNWWLLNQFLTSCLILHINFTFLL